VAGVRFAARSSLIDAGKAREGAGRRGKAREWAGGYRDPMKVLFVGGSGIISSACSQLAVEHGMRLFVLNRGTETRRPLPAQATVLHADIRDPVSVKSALGRHEFDAVVDWVAFTTEHVLTDMDLFHDRIGQYVFISSASAYQTPPARLPITESTPLRNSIWRYSQDKIACEETLVAAYRDLGFPATIVRPSHTYDKTLIPLDGGWTSIARMRAGKEVVVHGDGSSLWTLTHHVDFARGFVPLLGHPATFGDVFHITSDEWLTWDAIVYDLAAAAGVAEPHIVHVPSDAIAAADPVWGAGLLGDKTHSLVFDNSKLRRVVPDFAATIPFHVGAREIIRWYDEDPARQTVDGRLDQLMDDLVERYRP
jgi:nucleoside-diphosphate-sugar epimerase